MPELRNISVHVTDANDQVLLEYGVQRLRGNRKVSAYIQSETNKSFRVSVQAKIPYSPTEILAPHKYATRSKGSGYPTTVENDDDVPYIKLEDDEMDGLAHSDNESSSIRRLPVYVTPKKNLSSPLRPSHDHQTAGPPPYHILASLYLDGRQTPERRAVVYLDPCDPDFDAVVMMKARMVQNRSRTLTEHAWVFKDVGIEIILENMLIDGNPKEKTLEDEMVDAFGSAVLNAEGDIAREERVHVGKIVVELQRVTLSDKRTKPDFKAKHQEGEADDIDMGGIRPDIAHSAGFAYSRTLAPGPVRVVDYSPYMTSEGVFATFQFFYRSQGHTRWKFSRYRLADYVAETLRKLNLLPVAKEQGRMARDRNTINEDFSKKTPLSLTQAQERSAKAPKLKAEGFKVGEDVKKPQTKPEHNFVGHRGDKVAKSASEKQKLLKKQLASTLPTFIGYGKSGKPVHNYQDAPKWPPPAPPSTPIKPWSRKTSTTVLGNPFDPVRGLKDSAPLSSSTPLISFATQASESSFRARTIKDSQKNVTFVSLLNETLPDGVFRDPSPDRDEADDEREDPDLAYDDKYESHNKDFNPDEDDQGLHEQLYKVSIGKRRRSDSVNEETAVESENSSLSEENTVKQDGTDTADVGDGQGAGKEKVEGPGRRVRQRRNANTVEETRNTKAIEELRSSVAVE